MFQQVVLRNMNHDMIHQWLPERRAEKNRVNAIKRGEHLNRTLNNAEERLGNNQARWAAELERKRTQAKRLKEEKERIEKKRRKEQPVMLWARLIPLIKFFKFMHHQHLLNNMPKETLLLLATAHGDADALEALESTPEYQALAQLKSPNASLSKRMSQQIAFEMRDAHEKSKIPKNVRPPVVRTKSCHHSIKKRMLKFTIYPEFFFFDFLKHFSHFQCQFKFQICNH